MEITRQKKGSKAFVMANAIAALNVNAVDTGTFDEINKTYNCVKSDSYKENNSIKNEYTCVESSSNLVSSVNLEEVYKQIYTFEQDVNFNFLNSIHGMHVLVLEKIYKKHFAESELRPLTRLNNVKDDEMDNIIREGGNFIRLHLEERPQEGIILAAVGAAHYSKDGP